MNADTHYALIDRYSSSIAWVGEASSPELACTIAFGEANPGEKPKGYERVTATSVDAGFDVYLVAAGRFDEAASADAHAIAAIRISASLGLYQPIAPADLANAD